jgi:general secretion pathway protein G
VARIIGRSLGQVNGAWLLLLFTLVVCVACTHESAATRAYERAQAHIEKDEIDAAVRELQTIVDRYPETKVASQAREDLTLYRGLTEAVATYPARRLRDSMVRAARAVYTYRRRGSWPPSLDAVRAPDDPWGRPFLYKVKPGGGFVLGCLGSDGQPGGEGEARDLFIEDQRFVENPSVSLP